MIGSSGHTSLHTERRLGKMKLNEPERQKSWQQAKHREFHMYFDIRRA